MHTSPAPKATITPNTHTHFEIAWYYAILLVTKTVTWFTFLLRVDLLFTLWFTEVVSTPTVLDSPRICCAFPVYKYVHVYQPEYHTPRCCTQAGLKQSEERVRLQRLHPGHLLAVHMHLSKLMGLDLC